MKFNFDGFTNSKINEVIDEYIHSARDREILRRRLIDGETYQEIADSMMLSSRTVRAICSRLQAKVFRHLP